MEKIEIEVLRSSMKIAGFRTYPADVPIIALHGWLDNCHSFIPLFKYLSDLPLIAIDLPGHGHSSHIPLGCQYHFQDFVVWLFEIIEGLKIEACHLIGHSMGAGIASLFAGAFPDLVQSLVLIEGIGPLSGPIPEAPERLEKYAKSWQKLGARANPVYPKKEDAILLRQRSSSISLESAELLAQRGLIESREGVCWSHDSRLKIPSPLNYTEEETLAFLSRISCPTILIRGAKGFLQDSASLHERIKAVPNLVDHRIAGQHHLHMENSFEVSQIIRGFYLEQKVFAF